MSNMMQVHSVEIGEKTFQIRMLPFADARKVYSRLQRVMAVHGSETLNTSGLGLFMFAGISGVMPDEDLGFFCDVFGKTTDVNLGGTKTLTLANDANRTVVFAGAFEDVFAWLDACLELNFASVMGKLSAARSKLESISAAK